MRHGRTYNATRNTFFGLMNKFITILFPFVIRTIMIQTLGVEYLGLNSLFTSILNVLSLAELGFGSAMVYSMYRPIAKKDTDTICALLNLYRKYYRMIGSMILVIGLILTPFLKYLVKGSWPEEINLYGLYLIYLLNTVLTYFLFAYRVSLLNAYQRYDIIFNVDSVLRVLLYGLQITFLLVTRNYYWYILLVPIFTILNNLLILWYSKKLFPGITCRGTMGEGFVKDLTSRMKALIGHKIGGVIVNSGDNIVISSFLGLSTLAIYNNYYYVLAAISGVLDVGFKAILASVGDSLVNESKEKNYRLFRKLSFMIAWITGWCAICLICLLQDFVILWVGKSYLFESFSTVVLMGVYFYTWKVRIIGLNFKDAAGMWKEDFWKPYVGAIINLVVNIGLVLTIGIHGVLISTIVVMVFVYFPWETRVLFRFMFERSCVPYIKSMGLYTASLVVAGGITYGICQAFSLDGLVSLAAKLGICLIVPNVIFAGVWRRTREFKEMIATVKQLFRK